MSATQIAGQITSPTQISAVQNQANNIAASVVSPVSPTTFIFSREKMASRRRMTVNGSERGVHEK